MHQICLLPLKASVSVSFVRLHRGSLPTRGEEGAQKELLAMTTYDSKVQRRPLGRCSSILVQVPIFDYHLNVHRVYVSGLSKIRCGPLVTLPCRYRYTYLDSIFHMCPSKPHALALIRLSHCILFRVRTGNKRDDDTHTECQDMPLTLRVQWNTVRYGHFRTATAFTLALCWQVWRVDKCRWKRNAKEMVDVKSGIASLTASCPELPLRGAGRLPHN